MRFAVRGGGQNFADMLMSATNSSFFIDAFPYYLEIYNLVNFLVPELESEKSVLPPGHILLNLNIFKHSTSQEFSHRGLIKMVQYYYMNQTSN